MLLPRRCLTRGRIRPGVQQMKTEPYSRFQYTGRQQASLIRPDLHVIQHRRVPANTRALMNTQATLWENDLRFLRLQWTLGQTSLVLCAIALLHREKGSW